MFLAERRRGDFCDPSPVRISAHSRPDVRYLRRGHSSYWEMRIGSDDTSARACAIQILTAFPRRLRPPSLKSRGTASYVLHKVPSALHRLNSRPLMATHRQFRNGEDPSLVSITTRMAPGRPPHPRPQRLHSFIWIVLVGADPGTSPGSRAPARGELDFSPPPIAARSKTRTSRT